jgi:hypothetical protein
MRKILSTLLLLFAASAHAQTGYWMLQGGPVFVGKDQSESNGWTYKVEQRSATGVTVTNTFRDTVYSVQLDWTAPPSTIQPGEIIAVPGQAVMKRYTNPGGWSLGAHVSSSVKSPWSAFWDGDVPGRLGAELKLSNGTVRAPGPGTSWTLVYRLQMGTSYDFEFTYVWVAAAPPPAPAVQPAPAGGNYWKLQGGPVFVGKDQSESNGWSYKAEERSATGVTVTNTFRDTVYSARFEWNGPPDVVQPGEIVAVPGKAVMRRYTNPGGWSLGAHVSSSVKSPWQAFWEGDLPGRVGAELKFANSTVRAPAGGASWTLVYRLQMGTSYDFEFTYVWAGPKR